MNLTREEQESMAKTARKNLDKRKVINPNDSKIYKHPISEFKNRPLDIYMLGGDISRASEVYTDYVGQIKMYVYKSINYRFSDWVFMPDKEIKQKLLNGDIFIIDLTINSKGELELIKGNLSKVMEIADRICKPLRDKDKEEWKKKAEAQKREQANRAKAQAQIKEQTSNKTLTKRQETMNDRLLAAAKMLEEERSATGEDIVNFIHRPSRLVYCTSILPNAINVLPLVTLNSPIIYSISNENLKNDIYIKDVYCVNLRLVDNKLKLRTEQQSFDILNFAKKIIGGNCVTPRELFGYPEPPISMVGRMTDKQKKQLQEETKNNLKDGVKYFETNKKYTRLNKDCTSEAHNALSELESNVKMMLKSAPKELDVEQIQKDMKQNSSRNKTDLNNIFKTIRLQESAWREGRVTSNKLEYTVLAKITDWGYLTMTQDGVIHPVDKVIAQTLIKEKVLLDMQVTFKNGIPQFSGKNGFKLRELPTISLNDAINIQQRQQPAPTV